VVISILVLGCAGSEDADRAVSGRSSSLAGWLAEDASPDRDRGSVRRMLELGRADAAVGYLRRLSPDDWRNSNDLAVAYMERATSGDRILDQLRALESAIEARQAAPDRPETLFNLARASSRIPLVASAVLLWQELLELNLPTSRREVAAVELKNLRQPAQVELWAAEEGRVIRGGDGASSPGELVDSFPYQTRLFGQLGLVDLWLTTEVSERDRLERLGLEIGAALESRRGDSTVREAWQAIAERPAATCEAAYRSYASGVAGFLAGEGERAEAELQRSVLLLRECGNEPLRHWAEYYEVYSRFYADLPAAIEELERQSGDLPAENFPSLSGRLEWRLGTGYGNLGDSTMALEHYERGTELMLASSGEYGAAFGDILIAEALGELGEVERAWRHRLEAFEVLYRKGEERQIQSMLNEAIRDLARHGQLAVASAFADELKNLGLGSANPSLAFDGLRQRALVDAMAGDLQGARRNVVAARAQLERIGGKLGEVLGGHLAPVEIALLAESPSLSTLAVADKAVGAARAAGDEMRLWTGLLSRAEIRNSLAQAAPAEADLRELLSLVEKRRDSVAVGHRATALSLSQTAFDLLLRILLEQDQCEEAFALSERSRARALLDRAGGAEAVVQPVGTAEVQKMLAKTESLVEFAVLEEETVVWRISSSDVDCGRLPLPRAQLERLSSRFASWSRPRFDDADAILDLEELYTQLIASLELGPQVSHLYIVPDRSLQWVPFGALRNSHTGSFLVEERTVSVSPSASLLAVRSSARSRADGPPLLVADPDLSAAPIDLRQLQSARREVDAIARLVPESVRLEGRGASREAFRRLAINARWIHFAGHAIVNPDRPERSQLVFADGPGSVDLFEPGQLVPEMVLLSACRTLDGFSVDREGPLGIAGLLFAKGVDAVIATLWQTDDEASADFVPLIYRHLVDGKRPSEAVQLAVRELLVAQESPGTNMVWASFVVLERPRGG